MKHKKKKDWKLHFKSETNAALFYGGLVLAPEGVLISAYALEREKLQRRRKKSRMRFF